MDYPGGKMSSTSDRMSARQPLRPPTLTNILPSNHRQRLLRAVCALVRPMVSYLWYRLCKRTTTTSTGGCWTGVAGWERVAPQGCPGETASGRAPWAGRRTDRPPAAAWGIGVTALVIPGVIQPLGPLQLWAGTGSYSQSCSWVCSW
jgi:hypothetical protein